MNLHVPTIDLQAFKDGERADRQRIADRIDAACRSIGFLLIQGHGIEDDLLRQMHAVSREFFALPVAAKQALVVAIDNDIGYKRMGNSYLNKTMEGSTAAEADASDWKESFGARPIAAPPQACAEEIRYFGLDRWPAEVPLMQAVYARYFMAMTQLAKMIMAAFALGLGLDETYFDDKIDRHLSALAVHHYPPQTTAARPGQLRAGAHTDFGSLTILHTGDNPRGLQVWHGNAWLDVMPAWDQFVVNIGDLMAQWSNDQWVSTLHRVINPTPDRAHLNRQSLTFFHAPNWHAEVECLPSCSSPARPPRYSPVMAGPYVEEKLAKLRDPLVV